MLTISEKLWIKRWGRVWFQAPQFQTPAMDASVPFNYMYFSEKHIQSLWLKETIHSSPPPFLNPVNLTCAEAEDSCLCSLSSGKSLGDLVNVMSKVAQLSSDPCHRDVADLSHVHGELLDQLLHLFRL